MTVPAEAKEASVAARAEAEEASVAARAGLGPPGPSPDPASSATISNQHKTGGRTAGG